MTTVKLLYRRKARRNGGWEFGKMLCRFGQPGCFFRAPWLFFWELWSDPFLRWTVVLSWRGPNNSPWTAWPSPSASNVSIFGKRQSSPISVEVRRDIPSPFSFVMRCLYGHLPPNFCFHWNLCGFTFKHFSKAVVFLPLWCIIFIEK